MNTHLTTLRNPRVEFLRWALDITELGAWCTSKLGTAESVLWPQGGPGIGKSMLAGYFVEHIMANLTKSHVGSLGYGVNRAVQVPLTSFARSHINYPLPMNGYGITSTNFGDMWRSTLYGFICLVSLMFSSIAQTKRVGTWLIAFPKARLKCALSLTVPRALRQPLRI